MEVHKKKHVGICCTDRRVHTFEIDVSLATETSCSLATVNCQTIFNNNNKEPSLAHEGGRRWK